MQYANLAFAMFLFLLLFACSSNQSSKNTQTDNSENSLNTKNNGAQEDVITSIPSDGKLRDEHLRMYVSVKIKQEQLRYQLAVAQSQNTAPNSSPALSFSDTELEQKAINDFDFDSDIYYWSKEMINNTLLNYAGSVPDSEAGLQTPDNDVLIHNLSIVAKHQDEIRFANSYRLKLNVTAAKQPSLKLISKHQPVLSPKPST